MNICRKRYFMHFVDRKMRHELNYPVIESRIICLNIGRNMVDRTTKSCLDLSNNYYE